MFADGGQWVAAVLGLCWAGAVGHAEAVRRGRLAGRPTGNGVLAALGVAVLLFGLQAMLADRIVDAGGAATRLDTAAWTAVAGHRTPGLTAVAEVIDVVGGTLVLGLLAAAAAAVLLLHGRWGDAALVAGAPAVAGLTDLGFKVGYGRPRPPVHGRLVEVTGFSLPSGHTLDATIILGTLAVVLVASLRGIGRAVVVVLAVSTVAVAGAARVYLGVHWATDVLTGWLLGGAWVAVCAALAIVARAAAPAPDGSRTVDAQQTVLR